MERKMDLRVYRTRFTLSKALLDLLEIKSFDDITVNEICEHALVHRATFYNHFYDKEDLLNFVFDSIFEELYENTIEKGFYRSQKALYLDIASKTIDFLIDNKDKIKRIIENDTDKMLIMLSKTINKSTMYLLKKNGYHRVNSIPLDILVEFLTGGFTFLSIGFIKSEKTYSKEELLKYLGMLFEKYNF